MKKKATINKILSYCILAILLVIILGTFLVFVRNLFFDSREKQIEKQESITFDSLEMYKKLGKIRTASKDGIPIVVSVYFPFDKNDYEFYEDIKYDDVYYFVNPSLVDPEPSYVNAISKSIISYSNSSPCTNLYTYENLSNSIEEKTSTLHVYPNPVENYVRIKGNDIYRIELLDIYGRILSIQQIESFVNIDMSKYNVGIYYIKAYNNSGSFTKKIVKK